MPPSRPISIQLFVLSVITLILLISFLTNLKAKTPSKPELVKYYPKEISDVLNNPYMGWVPPAQWGPYSQPHKMVYAGITWKEIEPEKDLFDWKGIEKKYRFDYWHERNVKINIRIILDLPGTIGHMDIPTWLYTELNGDGSWYENAESGSGFSPNYNNAILISNHQRMLNAFGKRYFNNPTIGFIQIGSLGQWGEWHNSLSDSKGGKFPTLNVSNQYVSHYISAPSNKIFIMRRPFKIAKNNTMGLFNDMFGSALYTDAWNNWFKNGYKDNLGQQQPDMAEFWKTAPSCGEFAFGDPLKFLQSNTINETIRQTKENHISWLGPCCPANYKNDALNQFYFDSILKIMGYRFVLQSISHPNIVSLGYNLNIEMNLENKGVAPFYFKWPFELSLSTPRGKIVHKVVLPEDIRTWLPGIKTMKYSVKIPPNLHQGKYFLCIAILDPNTGESGIDLAIDNCRKDGRYQLDQVELTRP